MTTRREKGRRGHPDPNELIAVAGGPGRRIAPVPPEGRRALAEAVGESSRGKRPAGGLVDIGFVAQPQLDRVHAQPVCEIVHAGLERKHSADRAGSPHVRRQIDVQRHNAIRRTHVGHAVEEPRIADQPILIGAVFGCLGAPLVDHGDEVSGVVCPDGRDSPATGVVDPYQRLYGYPGLHVIDGSTIAANLGANPALTITALSERAVALWPNKGEADPRPALGSTYQRISPVPPHDPVVPENAPAALRLSAI